MAWVGTPAARSRRKMISPRPSSEALQRRMHRIGSSEHVRMMSARSAAPARLCRRRMRHNKRNVLDGSNASHRRSPAACDLALTGFADPLYQLVADLPEAMSSAMVMRLSCGARRTGSPGAAHEVRSRSFSSAAADRARLAPGEDRQGLVGGAMSTRVLGDCGTLAADEIGGAAVAVASARTGLLRSSAEMPV